MKEKKLSIVADAHIWGVESAFSSIPGFSVDLQVVESSAINRERLTEADILLTRSSTQVNATLLEGTDVRFVATATIGDDHYDKTWLESHGVVWANASGSSTGSVIEYMMAVFLELHARRLISIPESRLGIVGVGRIGSALSDVCEKLGVQLLYNDPPRAREEKGGEFSSMERVLAEADLVTLHTPMIRDGGDRTFHLLDPTWFSQFQGRGIINAARGGCVDNIALLNWLDGDSDRFAVLDCWEGEPNISRQLLAHPQLAVATPHIAGHSLDGKAANTQYVYNALCSFLRIKPEWCAKSELPVVETKRSVTVDDEIWQELHAIVSMLYPIMQDDDAMKGWLEQPEEMLPRSFSTFRRNYPVRRAWGNERVEVVSGNSKLIQYADLMGMSILNREGD